MDNEKHIDEDWKQSIESEKSKAQAAKSPQESSVQPSQEPLPEQGPHDESETPEFNFTSYITSLAFQGLVFLGEIPNPMNNKIEKNVRQSKFIIDTLVMLKEKTAGNLTAPENDALTTCIYELQMKYVEAVSKEGLS